MKLIILWGIIILLTVLSCKKTDPPVTEEPDYTGTASALLDSVIYEARSSCFIGNYPGFGKGYSISFSTYSSNNFLRGNLLFFAVPMDTGTYEAETFYHADLNQIQKTGCRYELSLDDGDVSGPTYECRPDGSTSISIDSLDKTTGELWGRFEAKLILGEGFKGLFPNAKDSLQFSNGSFYVKVKPK